MIMCIPNIFDREGLEGELIRHLKDIKKSLIKKGTISSKLIGIPLPEIRILWRQNKQKSKAEKDLFSRMDVWSARLRQLNRTGNACLYCGRNSTRWGCAAGFLDKMP
jgi:hypothetical protein